MGFVDDVEVSFADVALRLLNQVRAAISCGSQESTKQGSSDRQLGYTCHFFRLFECSCKDDAFPLPPTSSIQTICSW